MAKMVWFWSFAEFYFFSSGKTFLILTYLLCVWPWTQLIYQDCVKPTFLSSWFYFLIHLFFLNFILEYSWFTEKAMAPHSSTLAWKIPWMEEPGRLQSMGSLGVGHDWTALLSLFTFTFHFHALEKEMATQSSVLAWRIPGTGEPGGLPSMGSHRVRHDWSDLAAAAAALQ